jgi:hypothetical protein
MRRTKSLAYSVATVIEPETLTGIGEVLFHLILGFRVTQGPIRTNVARSHL